jgi:hypothetical protein
MAERTPSPRNEPQVRFVREQDGGPERELKAVLATRLDGRVTRAYLAVVDFGASGPGVACCFSGTADDRTMEGVVRDVASTFAEMFGAREHLDVMWVTAEHEIELAKVARPFIGQPLKHGSIWSRAIGKIFRS